MRKDPQHEFCMIQFKPAIAGLTLLLVVVLGWAGWHCTQSAHEMRLILTANTTPMGPPIKVKDKMLHPYWGNCNKCHLTTDAGKPISKVMAGPPINISQKMTHAYWGNCMLCHKVTDGILPQNQKNSPPQAMAAAANEFTAQTIGLKVQTVTAAIMQKFNLANEDGALILEVSPNSIADQAGLKPGDEIIRIGKSRIETVNNFEKAINTFKAGQAVKVNIYRGRKSKNIFLAIPKDLPTDLKAAANTNPVTQSQAQNMTQNQIETLAEQLGVPKTQGAVNNALAQQNQGTKLAATNIYNGKVAVAVMGPGTFYQISPQFGSSPYFIVFDPVTNNYNVAVNPNVNNVSGQQDVQTGQYMVDLGVSNVIAGDFNQGAINTLNTLRVNVFPNVAGSAQDIISAYLAGTLIPLTMNQYPQQQASPQMMNAYPYNYSGANPNILNGSQNVQTIY